MVERIFPIDPPSNCGVCCRRTQNPDGTLSITIDCSAKDKNPRTCPYAGDLPFTGTVNPTSISDLILAKQMEYAAQGLHDGCLGPIDPNQSN